MAVNKLSKTFLDCCCAVTQIYRKRVMPKAIDFSLASIAREWHKIPLLGSALVGVRCRNTSSVFEQIAPTREKVSPT
jgi:hypothetical protein